MFIKHESGHFQKEKLVVSPAFNQVVQSSLDRLLRVNPSLHLHSLQIITHPRLRVHQPQSGSYSCEQPRPVPLPAQPPVAARSTHLATPRAISTPIRCRQCPPQVIEDQWTSGKSIQYKKSYASKSVTVPMRRIDLNQVVPTSSAIKRRQ